MKRKIVTIDGPAASGKGKIVRADTDYGRPNYYTPVTEDEVNLTSNLCANRIASN